MPSGAAGEAVPLKQHDVAPAELRQVVGDTATDDAAADDDNFSLVGKCIRHYSTLPLAFGLPGFQNYSVPTWGLICVSTAA